MRVIISRVDSAKVTVDGNVTGEIGIGLLVYLGIVEGDTEKQAKWMADKLQVIRVFNDEQSKMNLSVTDAKGQILFIPNFTLAGKTQKGTRPSYSHAAKPDHAKTLFDQVVTLCAQHLTVAQGVFGGDMRVQSIANGPVTLIVDSP